MENPYWHPTIKPHAFDPDSVSEQCLKCFEPLSTSSSLGVFWESASEDEGLEESIWSYPTLVKLHQQCAELKLSSALLFLAISFRTLDDQRREDEGFREFVKNLETSFSNLHFYQGNGKTTLREACNKIVHATDVRPVYDNGSDRIEREVWGMDGQLELKGSLGGTNWAVNLNMFDFLEALLDVVQYVNDEIK
ncbi:hypothetical protein [Shimia sp.]|uniref:hypothetical protein n=1 Tax=Shimia sp. TaxID=1954381 RepID=UPI0032982ACD